MNKQIFKIIVIALVVMSCQPKKANSSMETTENKVVKTILDRRSIRSYLPDQIKEEELNTIIKCAINAPSGNNNQAWEVRIIQDAEFIQELNKSVIEYFQTKEVPHKERLSQKGYSVFHNAPTVIIIASEKNAMYSSVDCGLLGQNILLSAESMNIGSCIVGGFIAYGYFQAEQSKKMLEKLDFPENYEPLFAITLGYKNEYPDAKPRNENKVLVIK